MFVNTHFNDNQNNSTKCDHSVSHKMSAISMVCNNVSCQGLVEYSSVQKETSMFLMKLNDHDEEILPREMLRWRKRNVTDEEMLPRELNMQRGLTPRVKLLLNKLVFEYANVFAENQPTRVNKKKKSCG